MAAKVFVSVTMSLDGFIAPDERADDASRSRSRRRQTIGRVSTMS